jgi:Tfp pilus assembly protein PilF
MPHYSSQEIDEIADTLRRAKDREKPAHILFGGGCSKSAGIPLASELVGEIHKLYPGRCQRLADVDRDRYGACMKLLSPNERRDLLAPYLANARINWAHVALAQFMNEQFIERALTVNFDNLLARACGLLSLYPAIYDFGSAPTAEVSLIVSPAILHLHGQGHGVVLFNTEEETKAHAAKIAPVLRQSMDRPLIVIGYSGAADDVLRIVRQQYSGSEYLFWLSHDDDPGPAIRRAAEGHDYFKCVGGIDADRFLIELAQKLRCWPPTVCTNPIGHLLTELKPVSDYPTIPGNEVDILSTVRSRLAELERSEQQREQTTREIRKFLFEGHYEDAIKVFDAIPAGLVNADQRNLAVAAHMLAGDYLYDSACKATDEATAEKLFKRVEGKCETALQIKPGDPDVLFNWGVTIAARARRTADLVTADQLFREAEKKYEASLLIKPDKHEALNNWGNAFFERSRRSSDAMIAEQLFKEAELKYEASLQAKPDKHEALTNWGLALAARARRTSDAAVAEQFFKEAEAKYEASLRIKPDEHEALSSWGDALFERGRLSSDAATAEQLLKEAEAKYEASLRLKPDKHEALNNWGSALFDRARRTSDPTIADQLFKETEAKYEASLRIKPDKHEALNNWGSVLSERSRLASDSMLAEQLFREAEAKYEAALRIKPENPGALNNWGTALYIRAQRVDDPEEAVKLLKVAEGKYEAALRIKSDLHEAFSNWGLALAARAQRVDDPVEAVELFGAAEGKYEAALRIKSDLHEALGNWGLALAARAQRVDGPAKAAELFKAAEGKYEAALRVKPDDYEALNNWGDLLAKRAHRGDNAATAEDLFKHAETKYEAALQIKPNNFRTLHACGSVMLERAKRAGANELRTGLLNAAEAKLNMAEKLGDADAYNLACAYALLGRPDDCRNTLERTEKAGTLPTADHILRDDDLVTIRKLPWFGELIERLKKNRLNPFTPLQPSNAPAAC